MTTTYLHGGDAQPDTHTDHPATQAAARALEAVFGAAPVYIREGGSIPVTPASTSTLGLPVVLLGFTQPDGNAHAPNEWMPARQLRARHPRRSPGCGTSWRRCPR